jgi:hypothetical protein
MIVNDFINKNNNNRVIKYKNKLYGFNTNKISKKHILKKQVVNISSLIGKNIVIDFKKFKGLIEKHKIIEVTDIIFKKNNIKTNLYDIKCISLLSFTKKQLSSISEIKNKHNFSLLGGGIIPGVNGVVNYDVLKLNIEGTSLKTIMFIGEKHGSQDNCTKNYIDMYNDLIHKISKIDTVYEPIDIFYEQDSNLNCKIEPCVKVWLDELQKLLKPFAYNHNRKKSLLRVHWTDPINEYNHLNISNAQFTPAQYNKLFIKDLNSILNEVASNPNFYNNYTRESKEKNKKRLFENYPIVYFCIKNSGDLKQLIFLNKKIMDQAKKSILSEIQYKSFIQYIVDECVLLKFDLDLGYEWYLHGIFLVQRLSMDFYAFFRMLRKVDADVDPTEKLYVKNAIFHAGWMHTERLKLIFNEFAKNTKISPPNTKIESITTKVIKPINDKECLDFSFDIFIKTSTIPVSSQGHIVPAVMMSDSKLKEKRRKEIRRKEIEKKSSSDIPLLYDGTKVSSLERKQTVYNIPVSSQGHIVPAVMMSDSKLKEKRKKEQEKRKKEQEREKKSSSDIPLLYDGTKVSLVEKRQVVSTIPLVSSQKTLVPTVMMRNPVNTSR